MLQKLPSNGVDFTHDIHTSVLVFLGNFSFNLKTTFLDLKIYTWRRKNRQAEYRVGEFGNSSCARYRAV